MKKLTQRDSDHALKSFLEQHFYFKDLKEAGFFGKDIKKIDYQKQADRICWFFGFESVFEYITIPSHNVHISEIKYTFKCPVCTCEQYVKDSKHMTYSMKCIGCKRKLRVQSTMDGFIVTDHSDNKEKTETYFNKDQKFVIST